MENASIVRQDSMEVRPRNYDFRSVELYERGRFHCSVFPTQGGSKATCQTSAPGRKMPDLLHGFCRISLEISASNASVHSAPGSTRVGRAIVVALLSHFECRFMTVPVVA